MSLQVNFSVIIPFYNGGSFIHEATQSIEDYSGKYTYEIIIINDGSTEPESLLQLDKYRNNDKYIVLDQENSGANFARNRGCEIAKGKYLFFLDCDNKTTSEYIENALNLLEKDQSIGVVYGKPIFFGDHTRMPFLTREFDIRQLLKGNYIDMCAFVRKQAWKSAGGFDLNPAMTCLQDWELWLSIYEKDWKFHYLKNSNFYYRIHQESITSNSIANKKHIETHKYIITKHSELLSKKYRELHKENERLSLELNIYKKYFQKPLNLIQKVQSFLSQKNNSK